MSECPQLSTLWLRTFRICRNRGSALLGHLYSFLNMVLNQNANCSVIHWEMASESSCKQISCLNGQKLKAKFFAGKTLGNVLRSLMFYIMKRRIFCKCNKKDLLQWCLWPKFFHSSRLFFPMNSICSTNFEKRRMFHVDY